MKLPTLSEKDRRALFRGVAVLAPFVIYFLGVKPYRAALTDARDQLVVERDMLAREKAAVIATGASAGHPNADSALTAASPRLFEGRDDVMASAELQTYIAGLARRSRVLLQDAGTRPASSSPDGVRTLRVELRAESDVQGLATFLQALEGGSKLVRVDRLEISRTPGLEEKNGYETLNIAATVAGFAFTVPGAEPAPKTRGAGGGR